MCVYMNGRDTAGRIQYLTHSGVRSTDASAAVELIRAFACVTRVVSPHALSVSTVFT